MIFVPPPFTADAILEAIDAGIKVIAAITEGVPVLRHGSSLRKSRASKSMLIGPNCPGLITPGECKIGIMPGYIHQVGKVGVMSRSGTLTYEAVWQTSNLGLGRAPALDSVVIQSWAPALSICCTLFRRITQTEAILMIGEIGGSAEEEAAAFVESNTLPNRRCVHRWTHRTSRQTNGTRRCDHQRWQRYGDRKSGRTGRRGNRCRPDSSRYGCRSGRSDEKTLTHRFVAIRARNVFARRSRTQLCSFGFPVFKCVSNRFFDGPH